MKIIAHYLTFLALLTPACLAEDAWFLEMEPRYAEALLAKCRSGNLEDYRSALSKLPELIKNSKIKEIERNSSTDGDKGGVHFPQKRIPGKLGEKDILFHTGSSYQASKTKNTWAWRNFKIRQGEKMPQSNFEVSTYGLLGKEWAPTFIVNYEGTCRVLLERNGESAVDLPTWPAVVTVTADLLPSASFSWPISEDHRELLQPIRDKSAALEKGQSSPVFHFVDGVEHYDKRINSVRYGGIRMTWKTIKTGQSELQLEHVVFYPNGKRVADVRFGSLGFPLKGNSEAVDLNSYNQEFDKETGNFSNANKMISGKIQCRIAP